MFILKGLMRRSKLLVALVMIEVSQLLVASAMIEVSYIIINYTLSLGAMLMCNSLVA